MCFEFDALPPQVPEDRVIPVLAGGAGAERLTLESADGTRFAAALAECPDPIGGPAVIILPDVRGLYRFYVDLAERRGVGILTAASRAPHLKPAESAKVALLPLRPTPPRRATRRGELRMSQSSKRGRDR